MHDSKFRGSDIAAAKAAVEAEGLGESWQEVQENMQKMLAGEKIVLPALAPIRKIFGKFR
jgi:hypothetical protein